MWCSNWPIINKRDWKARAMWICFGSCWSSLKRSLFSSCGQLRRLYGQLCSNAAFVSKGHTWTQNQFPFYNGNRRSSDKKSATHCWICEEPFDSELDPEESIDLDHCHFSGQFLGWAHENVRWNSSLEKLVEILPDTHFDIMKAMFPSVSESNAHLLKQKGYYPYSYVCDRTKFSEQSLPPLSEWRNTLEGGKLAVSEENLGHANQMWKLLGCKTLQDYHDAYLKLDCALLACVCEFHRELSFRTYKLDCMHFYTLPIMAKEASLKICRALSWWQNENIWTWLNRQYEEE